jgi:type IV pilus assembly protein PilW
MKVIVGNSRMRGFSLVELMVAITVSSLLLVGVVALFISSRASYETTERLSRIQENGRFALDQLATDIRSTGYQGCARGTTDSRKREFRISSVVADAEQAFSEPDTADMRWNFALAAQGFEANGSDWTPTLDTASLSPAPDPSGDVLVLRIPRREVRALEVREKQTAPTSALRVFNTDPLPLAVGDTAVVSDCEARAFFQVTGYDAATGNLSHAVAAAGDTTPGNFSDSLLHPFKAGARVLPVTTMIYYIAPTPDPDDGDRMSLYRKTGGAALSDEIAQDIDRLELQYGIDDGTGGAGHMKGDGRVDRYVTAAEIDALADEEEEAAEEAGEEPVRSNWWDRVLTVQVALLARAPEQYGTDRDNVTYVLFSDPEPVTAGPFDDRTQRKVFTATLALRNQIFD